MAKGFFSTIAKLINPDNIKTEKVSVNHVETPAKESSQGYPEVEPPHDLNNEADSDSGKSQNQISQKNTTEVKSHDNGISTQESLTDAIVRSLGNLFRGVPESIEKKTLTIYISDYSLYILCDNERYTDSLAVRIQNTSGLLFSKIKLGRHIPDADNAIEVAKGVMLTVDAHGDEITRTDSFRLTVLQGSLVNNQKEVSLKLTPEKKRFNIGVGRRSMIPGKGLRINDIAIDDDTTSSEFEYNRFVSHCHARIEAVGSAGTYALFVEDKGTRLAGKRTRIFRDTEIIEIDNPFAPIMLRNGDIIELSKNVLMQFNNI